MSLAHGRRELSVYPECFVSNSNHSYMFYCFISPEKKKKFIIYLLIHLDQSREGFSLKGIGHWLPNLMEYV
jgi:hypothetical protein